MFYTKDKWKFTTVFVVIIVAILLSVFIIGTKAEIAFANEIELQEECVFNIPTLEDDFADDCVIIVLDRKTGGINKEHDINYFGEFPKESIEDLTYIIGDINNKPYLNKEEFHQILKIELREKSKQNVIDAILELQKVEGVLSAEPNYYFDLFGRQENEGYPNAFAGDNYYKQWALNGDKGIDAEHAWEITFGKKDVKVGIVDSGIAEHEDLVGNLVEGWDFFHKNNITNDDIVGHGTHVAGIVGATGQNIDSVLGVCYNLQLVPMQISNDTNGLEELSVLPAAVTWAINHNIDVLNFSFGTEKEEELNGLKDALRNYQGLVVCAAGNGGKDNIGDNNDVLKIYPADYSRGQTFSDRVISVGAIDNTGNRTSFTNYGANSVDIFAPGKDIFSTYPTSLDAGGYKAEDGTSMAAPFVTGVAALAFSVLNSFNHNLTQAQIAAKIKAAIINSAVIDAGAPLNGYCVSNGRLSASGTLGNLLFNTSILSDESISINGLKYDIQNDNLYLPSQINGRDVSQIANYAFLNQTGLTGIYVSQTVKSIGVSAFKGCTALSTAHLSWDNTQLTTINDSAFYGCTQLKTLYMSENIVTIGANAFGNCSLYSILLSNCTSLKTIGNSAFANCNKAYTISLPYSVTTIGANAFLNCAGAEKVEIDSGNSLSSIGESAFNNCKKLKSIVFSNSLKSIGKNAFLSCEKLESIVLSDSVTTIGSGAFSGCDVLTIYTSRLNTLSGWASGWNSLNRPIVLGCQLGGGGSYVTSFTKSASNPFNINAENGVSNPYKDGAKFEGWYTTADFSGTQYTDLKTAPNGTLYAKWKNNCVAEGTLITLADGSQVAVENLTGDEQLLVWNMFTGTFDTAPILFIDKEVSAQYEVINLYFSDGTRVKVISEHAFWDFDLNKYVFLRNDAAKYIGHWFNKQITGDDGSLGWTKVQLVDVVVAYEVTTAWSPVTYGHLCYYVDGMLSMPGGTEGLINIFDVDSELMKYDETSLAEDIATYGLYTYEEFAELLPVPELVFDAFNGQYLKVAIGKGLIDMQTIAQLFESYKAFFEV